MATIKGIWKFSSPNAGTVYSNGGFNYPFVCDGVSYTGFSSNNRYYITSGTPASSGYAHDLFYTTESSSVEVWHSYSTYDWTDEKYKTVDFGRKEITVSDAFYTWLTASAEYVPYAHDPSITEYTIKAATLIEIADAIREKTGTNQEIVPESMASLIRSIETSIMQVAAPTIELEGDILNIYDDTAVAESFDILVDGVVKTTIMKGV